MQTISSAEIRFTPELHNAVAQYRHKIFIERLGWNLPAIDGQEIDQFDLRDTVYVVAKDYQGGIIGCARLLPTTNPYLLGDVFPHLMHGQPIPCASDIWELSRFACNPSMPTVKSSALDTLYYARALLRDTIIIAAEMGAARLITVVTAGVERLITRVGAHVHRAGPPVNVDGKPTLACWIEIDDQTKSMLGIPLPCQASQ